MKINHALLAAANQLPAGFTIRVNVMKGESWVEIVTPSNTFTAPCVVSLGDSVFNAIQIAKDFSKQIYVDNAKE